MRQANDPARLPPVADLWQLLSDDPAEQAAFADLAAVQALPAVLAAPPNRLRHVQRLEHGGGVYFLKTFTRTSRKNRLWYRCSAPRARDDAEREWRVTTALRAAGFAAPRPVARGRAGATSYYLCAGLPGRPLRAALAAGEVALLRAAAVHCGRLLAAGFWLPDLSAEHVFVAAGPTFAVLDLHNGRIARAGAPPGWLVRRVLRHAARSLRGLPPPAAVVLRAAVRLLRAAGLSLARRRRYLRRQPPWATARRYEAAAKSAAYAARNPARAARELALLARVWPGRPGETVLDLPCGAGRLLPFLRGRGHRVLHGDGAWAMLQQARGRGPDAPPAVQADALLLPFAPDAVDGMVVFRFLHHLPPEAQRLAIAEACRVARRFVVLSFFHRCSVHHLRRTLRGWLGAPPTRFAQTLGALRRQCARHGFTLEAHAADLPFARDLWLAAFVRTGALAPPAGGA